jgi:hypothetical protein
MMRNTLSSYLFGGWYIGLGFRCVSMVYRITSAYEKSMFNLCCYGAVIDWCVHLTGTGCIFSSTLGGSGLCASEALGENTEIYPRNNNRLSPSDQVT